MIRRLLRRRHRPALPAPADLYMTRRHPCAGPGCERDTGSDAMVFCGPPCHVRHTAARTTAANRTYPPTHVLRGADDGAVVARPPAAEPWGLG